MEGQLYRFEFEPAHIASCMKEKMPSVIAALKEVPRDLYNVSCVRDVAFTQEEIVVNLPRHWSEISHKFFDSKIKKTIFTFLLINNRSHGLHFTILKRIFQALIDLEYVPALRIFACQNKKDYHDSVEFVESNNSIDKVFETTHQMLEISMSDLFDGDTPAGAEVIGGFGENRVVPLDVDLPRCWPYYFKHSPKWRSDVKMTLEEHMAYLADTDCNR
eukprot:Awhi_evm1s4537